MAVIGPSGSSPRICSASSSMVMQPVGQTSAQAPQAMHLSDGSSYGVPT